MVNPLELVPAGFTASSKKKILGEVLASWRLGVLAVVRRLRSEAPVRLPGPAGGGAGKRLARGVLAGELEFVEGAVEAALLEQLVVAAAFDDVALLQHDDAVGGADGAQAVGDDERGAIANDLFEGLLETRLGIAVDAG